MDGYIIRKAVASDIPFLADVVIAAEKGNSDKLSFSTLFNLPEKKIKELLLAIFEEEVDGCELSLSSFWVIENKNECIAAAGGWIENFEGPVPSKILKSNLISYFFERESLEFLKTKSSIIKDVLVEREPMTLQYEYFYVSEKHLGMGLDDELMKKIEENAMEICPSLEKSQCQMFKNSVFAMKILIRHGFKIVQKFKSDNEDIFDYLPSNEKCLFEKKLKNIE